MRKTARTAGKKSSEKAARRQARQETKEQQVRQPLTIEWRTEAQARAWDLVVNNDLTFLLGSAGSGKTFVAMAYAIDAVLAGRADKIVLTRPIVDAGEKMGYLPGGVNDKVDPYMRPLYDAMDKLLGKCSPKRDVINKAVILAPLCHMRGRTFDNAVCVFDEAQNATYTQFKLFLTRLGDNSRYIVTGDPDQNDLPVSPAPIREVVRKLENKPRIGSFKFRDSDCVRHPLVMTILAHL